MRRPWLIAGSALLVVVLAVAVSRRSQPKPPAPIPAAATAPRLEAVSALGTLQPAGDVRRLAAPSSAMGGSPRLLSLAVEEGQRVQKGELLATFDSRPKLVADLAALQARIASLQVQIRLQGREIERYQSAANSGAAAMVLLEEKKDELVKLQGQLREAVAQRKGLQVDLADSELRAPLAGTVLKIHSRPGERPANDGVLELGAGDQMEAVAEVYESDINRVKLGQVVSLVSENGGFKGSLQARVIRISPQVRQRAVLSTDPTGDADARVVEVRLALDPADAGKVRDLAGLKVIARFTP
ncbi:MAG: HlyD family efflux transporter periplasmic adaptor subunit [Cyanobacteria bacterium M_surface_7_m2_037]|nr:HlyD family efflux transporter periplasmic adaptor subunit [Cyanobacteria bacterium K_DeepCast_0m_m1_088]MBM5795732.1 HlyD family efflux transporter periplasmic adaptor subunit [Cyanobacteria bacterium M_surface_7_m2_037]MBM5818973.1 HlyD family efflux transporter periplasmic adaptor subunit [Cyanobacteria bacterium K_DeepCast_150m_m2_101]